ncbi:hypothetical protein KBA63_02080 [Candidatus Woesebacteria bacterium]|nr:hypothetical protein [Candidatus Woesebacteria bacterium]MBP9687907.1 hypothetical protein [Candidatus Woesebacteria bacterium]
MASKDVKEDAKLTDVSPKEQERSNHNARNDYIRSGGQLGERPVKSDVNPYGNKIGEPKKK